MERYSSLFRLPEKLYTQGSPLLIAAGALLKDSNWQYSGTDKVSQSVE